jgi:hypothetical protein
MRTHAAIAEYVDIRAKQVFEILLQADEIEQITAGLHLDEQVNIAGRTRLSSGYRAEHANVARTVIRCALQDLVPLHPQPVKVDHGAHDDNKIDDKRLFYCLPVSCRLSADVLG